MSLISKLSRLVRALRPAAPLALLLGLLGPATAASEFRQDGVALRLVALPPDAAGRVRGALEIQLEPGWKTYWIDPGPAGLAPQLDFSRSESLQAFDVEYPVPRRFQEGDLTSVGYLEPVALPFEATSASPDKPLVRLDLLIGVCREICVPVQASLTAEPTAGLSAQAAVAAARAALPEPVPPIAGWTARSSPDGRSLRITLPDASPHDADIFVAAPAGWSLGQPRRVVLAGEAPGAAFDIAIERRPTPAGMPLAIAVLLTSGESARLSPSLIVEQP
ncbi:protein-disulfide reductase DsbD domain-containing protein [Aureimonas sp. AU12]|uniref:protein-disulfide reductase DsbD domain-containing protein n=1 Tax=Aureimonas sp. AU12 TaxID=1638161 RepID=UPI00178C9AA8|nr:protein-disulfide reductase DsbD domain-containing protein [Aureimonas sp. AU12]